MSIQNNKAKKGTTTAKKTTTKKLTALQKAQARIAELERQTQQTLKANADLKLELDNSKTEIVEIKEQKEKAEQALQEEREKRNKKTNKGFGNKTFSVHMRRALIDVLDRIEICDKFMNEEITMQEYIEQLDLCDKKGILLSIPTNERELEDFEDDILPTIQFDKRGRIVIKNVFKFQKMNIAKFQRQNMICDYAEMHGSKSSMLKYTSDWKAHSNDTGAGYLAWGIWTSAHDVNKHFTAISFQRAQAHQYKHKKIGFDYEYVDTLAYWAQNRKEDLFEIRTNKALFDEFRNDIVRTQNGLSIDPIAKQKEKEEKAKKEQAE